MMLPRYPFRRLIECKKERASDKVKTMAPALGSQCVPKGSKDHNTHNLPLERILWAGAILILMILIFLRGTNTKWGLELAETLKAENISDFLEFDEAVRIRGLRAVKTKTHAVPRLMRAQKLKDQNTRKRKEKAAAKDAAREAGRVRWSDRVRMKQAVDTDEESDTESDGSSVPDPENDARSDAGSTESNTVEGEGWTDWAKFEEQLDDAVESNEEADYASWKDMWESTRVSTRSRWERHIHDLVEQGVLEYMKDQQRAKVFTTYFAVPKGRTKKARAIFSCKRLNAMVKAPPHFQQINHQRICAAMGTWTRPHMATADYKNYFYQFPLPKCVRPFFTIVMKGFKYCSKVLPMGLHKSPWIAQGVSSAVLYRARDLFAAETKASQPAIPDAGFESVIEVHDADGETIAWMGVVLDNLLVVAKERQVMEKLVSCVDATNKHFNIRTKVSEDAKKEPTLPEGWASNSNINEMQVGTQMCRVLTYLGIEYVIHPRGDGCVRFRHARGNVKGWDEDFQKFARGWKTKEGWNCRVGKKMTNRNVAHMIGVRIWDCNIKGLPLSSMALEMDILSKASKSMASKGNKNAWDEPTLLTAAQQVTLVKHHERFLKEAAEERTFRIQRRKQKKHQIYICSDSSKLLAAGVVLPKGGEAQTVVHETWGRKAVFDRSINWKETKVAIQTIKHVLNHWDQYGEGYAMEDCEIIFGEDNTTAMHALNFFHYPREIGLCGELYDLWRELDEKKVGLTAFYIRSEAMPADDPSRKADWDIEVDDENFAWQEKCLKARQFLEEEAAIGRQKRDRKD